MEDISSNDSATLIKLKIDSNVKIHMTRNVTCATIYLWEQSGIITQNYYWIFLSFLLRSIFKFLCFLQIVVEGLMCYFFLFVCILQRLEGFSYLLTQAHNVEKFICSDI